MTCAFFWTIRIRKESPDINGLWIKNKGISIGYKVKMNSNISKMNLNLRKSNHNTQNLIEYNVNLTVNNRIMNSDKSKVISNNASMTENNT